MDTTLPGANSSLFNVPKLAEDGSNWITYKERALTAIGARGLMRYTDGRAKKPKPFELDSSGKPIKADKSAATDDEVEELENKIDEFFMKDSLVKQQLFSTISDRLLLRVQKLENAAKIWAEICTIHEGKTELVQIDMR
ncbi:hypothetical protein M405DRAFT_751978, partial [Rhizopogon salebrosus TDB-379]